VCVSVLVLFAPTPAHAVDGVVLINQSTVISGRPGCPTGGNFPIIICQPGSYRLSSDLVVPGSTDRIDITTAPVNLDLNGFSVSGAKGAGTGIFAEFGQASVRNGTVSGFFTGVNLSEGQNSLIDVGSFGHKGGGVDVSGGVVSCCRAGNNQGNGFTLSFSTISDSVAQGNFLDAFYASRASAAINNVAEFNGGYGINASLRGSMLFGGNVILGNALGDVNPAASTISQKNNACSGALCSRGAIHARNP
jgi:hypothetical protein